MSGAVAFIFGIPNGLSVEMWFYMWPVRWLVAYLMNRWIMESNCIFHEFHDEHADACDIWFDYFHVNRTVYLAGTSQMVCCILAD